MNDLKWLSVFNLSDGDVLHFSPLSIAGHTLRNTLVGFLNQRRPKNERNIYHWTLNKMQLIEQPINQS